MKILGPEPAWVRAPCWKAWPCTLQSSQVTGRGPRGGQFPGRGEVLRWARLTTVAAARQYVLKGAPSSPGRAVRWRTQWAPGQAPQAQPSTGRWEWGVSASAGWYCIVWWPGRWACGFSPNAWWSCGGTPRSNAPFEPPGRGMWPVIGASLLFTAHGLGSASPTPGLGRRYGPVHAACS